MTATREDVVQEARSWLRTPYLHMGDVKGVLGGVDCCMILVRVYCDLGLVPLWDPRPYPKDWFLHQSEERYLNGIIQRAKRVRVPQPGDVVLFKNGRTVSHSGIVIGDDMMIHAHYKDDCTMAEIRGLGDKVHSYWSVFP